MIIFMIKVIGHHIILLVGSAEDIPRWKNRPTRKTVNRESNTYNESQDFNNSKEIYNMFSKPYMHIYFLSICKKFITIDIYKSQCGKQY